MPDSLPGTAAGALCVEYIKTNYWYDRFIQESPPGALGWDPAAPGSAQPASPGPADPRTAGTDTPRGDTATAAGERATGFALPRL